VTVAEAKALEPGEQSLPEEMQPSPTDIVTSRRQKPPRFLLAAAVVIAALLLLTPLVYLLIQCLGGGFGSFGQLVWRHLTATLLWNTVSLTVVVTLLCAVIGTLTAWCVERTELPGRRVWAVLLVLPFAIPDIVVSWGWASVTTLVQGFGGAVLIMTLTLYPLVYLFVAASLRSADPGLEEAARGLGLGRITTFWRVTVDQCRGAIVGGCVVVALLLLAEYGAFEDLGYRTFTTEIFAEADVSFNIPTACALTLVLLVLAILVLGCGTLFEGKRSVVRTGRLAQRETPRQRLGWATVPVLGGLAALIALAVGVPIGVSIYWMFEGGPPSLPGGSLLDAAVHTVVYAAIAAALASALALPVALLSSRYPTTGVRLVERSTFLILAVPGLIVALALSYYSERYVGGLGYQSVPMLILAYTMLFFPLALVGVRASTAYAPVSLEHAASSLGLGRLAVFRRVTLPLVGPGLATGFCLVFLAVVTELTATLFLVPAGVQTLATQFWSYEENLSYGQAAPYGLVMIAIVVAPTYVLARYFQRLPARASRSA
jgi:iron(III) transport system permease protein